MLEEAKEKWTGAINEVVIGATKAEGGTRAAGVTIGGDKSLPFMHYEAPIKNRPIVALEVWDREPDDWPQPLMEALGDAVKSPVAWAKKGIEEFGADLICLKLMSTHPDFGDATAKDAVQTVKAVLAATSAPLIIWGCEHDEKDNEVLPRCSEAAKGEKCLMGVVTEDNYKTLVASCIADGHSLIGLSPIDINIAKQINILVMEMGFPANRIVMYPTTGALGYGLEYCYSIQERGRVAALSGDKMMAMPVICMVGQEAWHAKEARAPKEEAPDWGDEKTRGLFWEIATAVALLEAGSDILVLRHPAAIKATKDTINKLMA
ncbi:MAG: acetyl-CoA decarbonylase/synthase complex subunit delta [Lentisphaerae bacterium]|nr:acetyl-CoA decarbonylase/synthase complex subunit delta [Lentisphaerota bacterium]